MAGIGGTGNAAAACCKLVNLFLLELLKLHSVSDLYICKKEKPMEMYFMYKQQVFIPLCSCAQQLSLLILIDFVFSCLPP